MATDEDARTAARRIVEQVMNSRAPAGAGSAPTALADEVVDEVVIELTDEFDVEDPIAIVEGVAEDLAEDLAEDAGETIDVTFEEVDASEPRARARALVAEVLAAHARAAVDPGSTAQEPPEDHLERTAPNREPGDRVVAGRTAATTGGRTENAGPPADSEARLRARELVAAAIADAEDREATARAEAEARAAEERATAEAAARAEVEAERERAREAARRIEEARRAEAERAEAERVRQEAIERERREEEVRLAEERDRAAAEERERVLWADADRDVATATTPVDRRDRDDRTVPMSVAELASSGHPDDVTDDDPERTAMVATDDDAYGRATAATGTLALPRRDAERDVEDRPTVGEDHRTDVEDLDSRRHEGPRVLEEDPRVLEAIVDLDTPLPPARGGRWLLVSVVGAITLAVVFPLAIRALLQLVALS